MHFGSRVREPADSRGTRVCHCCPPKSTSKAAEPKGRGTPCRRKGFLNISYTGQAAAVTRPVLNIFSVSKNILELSIKLLSPSAGKGEHATTRTRSETTKEEEGKMPDSRKEPRGARPCWCHSCPGHFCSLLLPSQSHPKSGAAPEAPLSVPFTGATVLSKTSQEDDCSSLPTPKLLQKQQSLEGKVLRTSSKPSEEREIDGSF